MTWECMHWSKVRMTLGRTVSFFLQVEFLIYPLNHQWTIICLRKESWRVIFPHQCCGIPGTLLPSSIPKSRKECSELTFQSFSYFEINISNFLKTNSLNHSWICSTWAYSFLSHKYWAQKSMQASSLSSILQSHTTIPQMLQLPDAWVLIT